MSTTPSLGSIFRDALTGEAAANGAELDAEVDAYVAAARARWPDLHVPPADLADYMGKRSDNGRVPPVKHAGDLMLACACVRGEARAFHHFSSEYGHLLQRLLMRRGATSELAADVRQQLAERLLVADPGANRHAKIADYRGLGALRSWVATAAAMLLLTWQRAAIKNREQPKSLDEQAWIGPRDPELDYLKQRHVGDVRQAIVVALSALSDRDKAVLHLYVGKRSSIDVLGSMYGVNRATAARWIAAARRELRRRTIRHLQDSLRISPRECDSLIALVNSQLDVSILEHLGPSAPPKP